MYYIQLFSQNIDWGHEVLRIVPYVMGNITKNPHMVPVTKKLIKILRGLGREANMIAVIIIAITSAVR